MKLLTEKEVTAQNLITTLIKETRGVALNRSNFTMKDDKLTLHLQVNGEGKLIFNGHVLELGESLELTYDGNPYWVTAEPRLYHHRILTNAIELVKKEGIDLSKVTISTTTVWQLYNHTIETPLVMLYGEVKEKDLVDEETGLKVSLISKYIDEENRVMLKQFKGLGVMADCPIKYIETFDFSEKAIADGRNREQTLQTKSKKKKD